MLLNKLEKHWFSVSYSNDVQCKICIDADYFTKLNFLFTEGSFCLTKPQL